MSTGFTVQRGYRAGGFEALPLGQNEFGPEYTTNYEFSFRSLWLDDRLTANANAYYTDWTDQQVSVPGPSGTFLDSRTDNAGESKLYGFELETFWSFASAKLRLDPRGTTENCTPYLSSAPAKASNVPNRSADSGLDCASVTSVRSSSYCSWGNSPAARASSRLRCSAAREAA